MEGKSVVIPINPLYVLELRNEDLNRKKQLKIALHSVSSFLMKNQIKNFLKPIIPKTSHRGISLVSFWS